MAGRVAVALMRNRHLLGMTLLVLLVAGVSALSALPRTEDPRIVMRVPQVLTYLPGASAERVESLVTEKLEERLREVAEIAEIESTSRAGVSVLSIELQDDVVDNDEIIAEIRDELTAAAAELPPEASAPDLDDKRGATTFSLITAITVERESELGIASRLAEALADRLRGVPGTELVRVYGAPEEELTVAVDPRELAALGLTTEQLAAVVRDADAKTPSGVLRGAGSDLLLEVRGELDSTARVAEIPLLEADDGSLVRVGDVARVEKAWREPPREVALVDGVRAVYVAARMAPAERADAWAERARATVAAFAPETGGPIGLRVVFDQSHYTIERLTSLATTLLLGAGVVVMVVLFTMGLRSGLVIGAALPLTAAAAFFLLMASGGTLQQMSIFGMMIAIGLLIDNAIVVVDEVGRRRARGETPEDAAHGAVGHLFQPLLASTLTTILAFAPIPLLAGNIGDFIGPIGVAVILSLVASFVLAMTLIPALAGLFVRPDPDGRWWRSGVSGGRFAERFGAFLHWGLRRPWTAIAIAVALPVLGFAITPLLGNQFFPRVDRNMFDVQVWLPPEASLESTRRSVERAEALLREHDAVQHVSWLVGGSFPSVYYNLIMNRDDAANYARGVVETRTADEVPPLIAAFQAEVDAALPGVQVVARRFGQGPPVDAEIEFKVVGPGIPVLQDLGETIRRELYRQPEVLHTQATMERGEPKLFVDVDEDEARLAGLSLREVAAQLQGGLDGRTGGSVIESLEELPVRVRRDRDERSRLDDVAALQLLRGDGGAWLPLEALGGLSVRPEVGGITRCAGERCNRIKAYLESEALPIDVSAAAQRGLAESGFALPAGYRLVVGGDSEEQGRAIGALLRYAPVLLVSMITTVVLSFRSVRMAALLFSVAFLSAGIGLLATFVAGFPFSFNGILGTAGLIGVALNDSIVVLASIREKDAGRTGDVAAVVDGVLETGRHVVSTTLTTIGGFLPLLLFVGGDFWPPLAVVLAGGVAGATLLAVLFVPAGYVLAVRGRAAAQPVDAPARASVLQPEPLHHLL